MLFIFDMGGVVSGNGRMIPAMTRRLGISADEFLRICSVPEETNRADLYNHGLLAAIQSGAINSSKFWDFFRKNAEALLPANHPSRNLIAIISRSENLWETCFAPEPIQGTVNIIASLKKNGHRVVCGTNTLDAHYVIHQKLGDYAVFDAVYASHFMGVIKPQREFWELILEAEKTEPGQAFFIDDNETNVAASREVGLRGIQFISADDLAARLAEFLTPTGTPFL